MPAVTVQHVDGDRFTIGIRDHLIAVDQPDIEGGEDTAPTPTELFVASLASCVAFYARRYLARHKLPTTGLRVTPSTGWGHTGASERCADRDRSRFRRSPQSTGSLARGGVTLHRAQHRDPSARDRHRRGG
jgi:hypothetical protein